MSTLAQRIDFIIKSNGISAAELARKAGISRTAITLYRRGETQTIKADAAARIASAYGVSLEWLINGTGTPQSGKIIAVDDETQPKEIDALVAVPELRSVRLNAGAGAYEPSFDDLSDVTPRFYRRSWLEAHGYKAEALRCVTVSGDSMEPTLFDGDTVTVNTLDRTPIKNGHVYAICVDDLLRVKRLAKNLRGDLTVFSDNSERYAPEIFKHDDESVSFIVIGCVIDRSAPAACNQNLIF